MTDTDGFRETSVMGSGRPEDNIGETVNDHGSLVMKGDDLLKGS
jgi:hypothetical protein